MIGTLRSKVTNTLSLQAAQDRQARGVKRSADVILKDEEERQYYKQQGDRQQQALSGLTESYTADGNDDGPLADEDDMEEEVVGELGQTCWRSWFGWHMSPCICTARLRQQSTLHDQHLCKGFMHLDSIASTQDHRAASCMMHHRTKLLTSLTCKAQQCVPLGLIRS